MPQGNQATGGFRPLRSSRVWEHPPIPVREDVVETPGGRVTYTVLEYYDACASIAVIDKSKIVLVKVVRHPLGVGKKFWELPGGIFKKGEETLEECAGRELQEETGYVAEHIEPLLPPYYPEPTHSTEALHLFVAWGLRDTGKQQAESEGLPEVGLFTLDRAFEMVCTGEIKSSWSIIGILAAKVSYALYGKILSLGTDKGGGSGNASR